MIGKLGLENRVFLPGVIDDIRKIYQKADIFVSSSLYESFGLAAAEAMAFQIPCIGFRNCTGIREIVEDGPKTDCWRRGWAIRQVWQNK